MQWWVEECERTYCLHRARAAHEQPHASTAAAAGGVDGKAGGKAGPSDDDEEEEERVAVLRLVVGGGLPEELYRELLHGLRVGPPPPP